MQYIAAYGLLVLGGNDKPTADDVENVIRSSGSTIDKDIINLLVKKLEGRPFNELMDAGMDMLKHVSYNGNGQNDPRLTPSPPPPPPLDKPMPHLCDDVACCRKFSLVGIDPSELRDILLPLIGVDIKGELRGPQATTEV